MAAMTETTDDQEIEALVTTLRGLAGPESRLDALFASLHHELRRVARSNRAALGASPTLDTTSLVHEAYIKLSGTSLSTLAGRRHFFALAARAMRQIIVDHARRRLADKRGGHAVGVSLSALDGVGDDAAGAAQALELHQALQQLEQQSPRLAQVVSLRFYGGLTEEEIAELIERDPATVRRDWAKARAWLYQTLGGGL
jgi:RNA polymerase sigma factor (TIGR02999 family)